ncbi:MAG: hypothetical protein B0A82_26945 [Alkalinema sp. CACIAM 70d]|nr:MAG: hypothetical protein B0A82_26945 [Alkalinema sp. CACIAM 70d]
MAIMTFLGGGITGAIGGILTAARWYADSEKKKYAAERDFAHLKRNQEQLSESLKMIGEEVEVLNESVIRLEALISGRISQK